MIPSSLSITVLSDPGSWMNAYIPTLVAGLEHRGHRITWVHDRRDVPEGGDIAFVLSCTRLLPGEILARSRHNIVVHQSDLPHGRGWSPLAWQIIEGKDVIPVCLFEAVEALDAGPVYFRAELAFEGHELADELRAKQAECSVRLCLRFVDEFPAVLAHATPQAGEPSYYPRRTALDSRLDVDKTLREQFDLLRIVDNERYPAYFELNGVRYVLKIEPQGRTVEPGEAGWTALVVPTATETRAERAGHG